MMVGWLRAGLRRIVKPFKAINEGLPRLRRHKPALYTNSWLKRLNVLPPQHRQVKWNEVYVLRVQNVVIFFLIIFLSLIWYVCTSSKNESGKLKTIKKWTIHILFIHCKRFIDILIILIGYIYYYHQYCMDYACPAHSPIYF